MFIMKTAPSNKITRFTSFYAVDMLSFILKDKTHKHTYKLCLERKTPLGLLCTGTTMINLLFWWCWHPFSSHLFGIQFCSALLYSASCLSVTVGSRLLMTPCSVVWLTHWREGTPAERRWQAWEVGRCELHEAQQSQVQGAASGLGQSQAQM